MKRIVSIIICAVLLISVLGLGTVASATSKDKAKISTIEVSGIPGNTIDVPVKIENNPGFSNIAFSFVFDNSLLSYKSVTSGLLNGFSIFDHTKKGKITVSYTGDFDIGGDSTLVYFTFKVKEKAKVKTSTFKICNVYLKNAKSKAVKYSISNGSVAIGKACEGVHIYSNWKLIIPATCNEEGVKICSCTKCGDTKIKKIAPKGHQIDKRFTIDVVAEGSKPGMLSRHCSVCGAKTNIITYTNDNSLALAINTMIDSLSDNSITNLVYFLNGGKTYPKVKYDVTDVKKFILSNNSSEERDDKNYKSAKNDDGSINIDVAVDKILRRLLGDNQNVGILTAIKRAAIAGELPFKIVGKLICLILI